MVSELAFASAKSVFIPTIADLALPQTHYFQVSLFLLFWKPSITGYIGSLVYHIGNEEHYVKLGLSPWNK